MYKYSKPSNITKEEILDLVSEEDIFNIVIDDEILLDKEKLYTSPFREDRNPDCYFEIFDNNLVFVDFADSNLSYTAIFFIKEYFNLDTYEETYQLIYDKLIKGKKLKKRDKKIYSKEKKKTDSFIQIIKRNFDIRDKKYWSKYGITSQNLIDDKVIPISSFRAMNNKGNYFTSSTLDISYAYTEFEDDKIKIYRPENKNFKWFTNCNPNDLGSIKHLTNENYVIISKSYKDCRVLRNLNYNSFWLQNEVAFPSKTILKRIIENNNIETIYILLDNDKVGRKNSEILKHYISSFLEVKIILIFTPIEKDPSDMYVTVGEKELQKFLNNNIKK